MIATASATAGYDALHSDAVLVDRSDRARIVFSGEKAKEALGGLLTNDVAALAAGQTMRAVALTPKGRVIAVVRVLDRGVDLLVDTESASGEAFAAMIKKFVNPRLAKHAVVTDNTACLGVYGPGAAARIAGISGLTVLPSSDLGVPGFDLIGTREEIGAARRQLESAGLGEANEQTVEIARVEAGLPRFGVDMDAETIPQEANLDKLDAISFDKGCYTGQEVVARIHFRGHVNRHLRRLSSVSPLNRGDVVLDAQGKEVGDVRTSVISPRRGPLALAMLRREVEPGSEVRVRSGGSTQTARCEAIA